MLMKKLIVVLFAFFLSLTSSFAVEATLYMLNGDQFDAELLTEIFSFITPYSEITLTSKDITEIVFPSPGSRITKIFTNMSREKISGILLNDSFKIKTVGNELSILKDKVKRMVFKNELVTPLKFTADILLRSGDHLFAMIEAENIELETSYGMLNIDMKDIQNIDFEGMGNVVSSVTLLKENEMKGVIVNPYIRFKLMNDTTIEIVPDRIESISFNHRVFDAVNSQINGFESASFNSSVNVIEIDAFNKYLYAGYQDGYIRTWDLHTGKLFQEFKAHEGAIRDIIVDSQAKYLVTGSQDSSIKIWDLNSEENLRTLLGHKDWIISLDFSSDDSIIISGSRDKTIKIWDFETGKLLQTISDHTSTVMAVDIDPTNSFLFSTSVDQKCLWWDLRQLMKNKNSSVNLLGSYQRKGDSMRSGIISVDGKYAIAGSSDGEIIVWNTFDESKMAIKVGVTRLPKTMITVLFSFAIDQKSYLIAGNTNSTLHLFELTTNILKFNKSIPADNGLTALYITKDGKYILKGFQNGRVTVEQFMNNQ